MDTKTLSYEVSLEAVDATNEVLIAIAPLVDRHQAQIIMLGLLFASAEIFGIGLASDVSEPEAKALWMNHVQQAERFMWWNFRRSHPGK